MLFDQIARNKRKTWLLLLVFFLLLGLVGYGVGYLWLGSGFGGLILALVIGFIYYHDFPINQCRYGYEWCTRG